MLALQFCMNLFCPDTSLQSSEHPRSLTGLYCEGVDSIGAVVVEGSFSRGCPRSFDSSKDFQGLAAYSDWYVVYRS